MPCSRPANIASRLRCRNTPARRPGSNGRKAQICPDAAGRAGVPDPTTTVNVTYSESQIDPADTTRGGEVEIFGTITPRWAVYFSGAITSSSNRLTGDPIRYELREVRSPVYALRT